MTKFKKSRWVKQDATVVKPQEQTENEKWAEQCYQNEMAFRNGVAEAERAKMDGQRQREADEHQKQMAADAAFQLFDATPDEIKTVSRRIAARGTVPASVYVNELRKLRAERAA
jgi:hypothetical protein